MLNVVYIIIVLQNSISDFSNIFISNIVLGLIPLITLFGYITNNSYHYLSVSGNGDKFIEYITSVVEVIVILFSFLLLTILSRYAIDFHSVRMFVLSIYIISTCLYIIVTLINSIKYKQRKTINVLMVFITLCLALLILNVDTGLYSNAFNKFLDGYVFTPLNLISLSGFMIIWSIVFVFVALPFIYLKIMKKRVLTGKKHVTLQWIQFVAVIIYGISSLFLFSEFFRTIVMHLPY